MAQIPLLKPAAGYDSQCSSLKHSSSDLRLSLPSKSAGSTKARHRAVRIPPGSWGPHATPGRPSSPPPPFSAFSLTLSVPSPPPSKSSAVVNRGVHRPRRLATPFHMYPTLNQHPETPSQAPGTSARLKRATDLRNPIQIRRMHSDNTLSICKSGKPLENPMTTRLYRSDYGLDGTEQGHKTPPIFKQRTPDSTSLASTPLAFYAETDSDASSSCKTSQFEFPNPPDSTSPLLPTRNSLPKDANEQCINANYRKYLTTPDSSLVHGYWDLDADADICLPNITHDLELVGEELLDSVNPLTRLQNELGLPTLKTDFAPHVNGPRRKLSHARSASSVLPPYFSYTNSSKVLQVPEMSTKSDKPPVETSESLQHLELSLHKLESLGPSAQDPAAKNTSEPSNTFIHPHKAITPSLASAGRRKPTQRAHLSVSLTGLGFSSVSDSSTTSRSLASPFHHRATKSQSLNQTPSIKRAEVQGSTSFMNITPERKGRDPSLGTKEKMRKLLARASSGVISWGKKSLTNTKR